MEKELADRLRGASKEERRHLYTAVYDELFRRVPHHQQLALKVSPQQRLADIAKEVEMLRPFLGGDSTFLEIGPGDCALSLEVAKSVRQVYAVDVSTEITKGIDAPANFRLAFSDGCSVPVPPGSVDVAYSTDLIEHLHPDDAFEQLRNVHGALAPGGRYLCVTPNGISGPHDISMYFDKVATGFHLKEYTVAGLCELFRRAGFSRIRVVLGARGRFAALPALPSILCESLLDVIPHRLRRPVAGLLPFRLLLMQKIRLVGIK